MPDLESSSNGCEFGRHLRIVEVKLSVEGEPSTNAVNENVKNLEYGQTLTHARLTGASELKLSVWTAIESLPSDQCPYVVNATLTASVDVWFFFPSSFASTAF